MNNEERLFVVFLVVWVVRYPQTQAIRWSRISQAPHHNFSDHSGRVTRCAACGTPCSSNMAGMWGRMGSCAAGPSKAGDSRAMPKNGEQRRKIKGGRLIFLPRAETMSMYVSKLF